MMFRLSLFVLLNVAWLLTACNNGNTASPAAEALPHSHRFTLRIDGTEVQAQLALTQDEMAKGLMGRQELAANEGMIFVYPRPIRASFWMKNTPLPLDIGFFDPSGKLIEIYRLYPNDETSLRSRSNQVQFALEMNQGWFSRHGIRTGASLDLDLVRQALTARGFDPAKYGL